jgi:uncharacterized protein (DUF362 family)/ferredoxin
MFRFDAIAADSVSAIKTGLGGTLSARYADLLPADKSARILLKPNLNANMNALTGNTTDLRILAAVVEWLKDSGHANITIGEGTNSGYYRNRISVISRLKVDALGKFYGVTVKDLNYSDPVVIPFEDGVEAAVARECVEADLFINMPKLKTHFEAGMSVCLKNLMGCLVGQENKKKTHQSLAANIVNINRALKPHLHIVDAVISMEGLGPTRGTPLKTGMVFVGTDPYLIDLLMTKFAGFDPGRVRTLVEARSRGIIDESYRAFVREYEFPRTFSFAPPVAGPIANFIHSPKRQKYFLAVRNTAIFNALCSTRLVGWLLYVTGLRQDVFIEDEMLFEGLTHKKDLCSSCGKCAKYCPLGLELPEALGNPRCIECMYCQGVCPEKAIEFRGRLGFMREQERQYDTHIRRMA